MIKEAFRDDKHFILARLRGRGQDKFKSDTDENKSDFDFVLQEGQIISNHFNVYSIIKLIFKKLGAEFVGRFHHKYAITAKNPLTNTKLVGEVEFFQISNPFLTIEPKESRYPEG